MLALHSFCSEGNFYIWGENSFEDVPAAADSGSPARHPWCADGAALREALKELSVRHGRRAHSDGIYAFVLLPSRGGLPVPSSPLLGDTGMDGQPVLAPFQISAVEVRYEELAEIAKLANLSDETLPAPGLMFSSDTLFIARTYEYAALMAYRGTFLPDMTTRGDSIFSVWSPLYLAKYQDERAAYVNSVPPILGAYSFEPGDITPRGRFEVAEEILRELLDDIVRSSKASARRGRKVDSSNPHEIWLSSLTWPKLPLDTWSDALEALRPQVAEWINSVQAVTDQPWKLLLRLEEPTEDGDDNWRLSWHLQSSKDPSLTIPAAHVWSPGASERAWFAREGINPRRYLLQSLGHLALFVAPIAHSLEQPCPTECLLSTDELFEFLQTHVPAILDQGIQIHFPASWGNIDSRPKLAVKGTLHDTQSFRPGGQMGLDDLLAVDWSVSLGDDVLTEDELKLLTELKTPLVNIRGKWTLLYRDEIEKITAGLKKLPEKIKRREALLSSFSGTADDMPVLRIDGSRWLESIRAVLTGAEGIETLSQPEGFVGSLRPYQTTGFSWLAWIARHGLGCCLADDMGLGKTIQALALISFLRESGERRPTLLICPTSVIENWRREAEKFTPSLPTLIHHGIGRLRGEKLAKAAADSALVLSSYSILQRDCAALSEIPWCGVILDEAQNIKNPDTRQARAARAIPASWRIALTGTPVENHVGDMWSMMEFLLPGLLPNKTRFTRDLLRPIQAGETKAMERIKRMTGPFILRRLKTDKNIISDLPEKIETKVFCPLGKEQATLYSSVLTSVEDGIFDSDGIKRRGLVLAAITSLKQVCDHPALYLKDNSELRGRSGKLARLADLAEEMLSAGDRALIFTQYAEMGALLKKFLQETFGREALFLHGGVERAKRDEMVRRFQESKDAPPFFVLSLKAGGTGLNLTGANHVIMFDRWWNPAVEQQAVDRAYRIGQKSNVQVHYFCCKGTLEEKIEALIESKRRIADAVVGSGESWLANLSDEELRDIFTLRRDAVEDIK